MSDGSYRSKSAKRVVSFRLPRASEIRKKRLHIFRNRQLSELFRGSRLSFFSGLQGLLWSGRPLHWSGIYSFGVDVHSLDLMGRCGRHHPSELIRGGSSCLRRFRREEKGWGEVSPLHFDMGHEGLWARRLTWWPSISSRGSRRLSKVRRLGRRAFHSAILLPRAPPVD